jgi:hypothetical protein
MTSGKILLFGAVIFLIIAGLCLYFFFPTAKGSTADALALSSVVLVGFSAIVVLMGAFVIVFQVLGLASAEHALALPEGSVRALIAFSLLLIFVCLSAFLYVGVNSAEVSPGGKTLSRITVAELSDLKAEFVVAYEPAKDEKGAPLYELKPPVATGPQANATSTPEPDTTKPLYDVTYYSKRSKEADDLAKQIFTTLATIFVSVISFYFGSSVTAAGVGAGAAAVKSGDGKKSDPAVVLTEIKALAHDAQTAADQTAASDAAAQNLGQKIQNLADQKAKDEATKQQQQIHQLSETSNNAAQTAKAQIDVATKAASIAATETDAAKVNSASADLIKARDAAKAAAETAKASATQGDDLLKKITKATTTP